MVYAAGAKFEKDSLPNFLSEKLTGLNNNLYIHDKFMLLDPLSEDPTVITGSANFSVASQKKKNDENMLMIRSDKGVADIYFREFMRIFDHLYARYLAKKIEEEAAKPKLAAKGSSSYLKPNSSWVAAHFGKGPRSYRRQYLHGAWEA